MKSIGIPGAASYALAPGALAPLATLTGELAAAAADPSYCVDPDAH